MPGRASGFWSIQVPGSRRREGKAAPDIGTVFSDEANEIPLSKRACRFWRRFWCLFAANACDEQNE